MTLTPVNPLTCKGNDGCDAPVRKHQKVLRMVAAHSATLLLCLTVLLKAEVTKHIRVFMDLHLFLHFLMYD